MSFISTYTRLVKMHIEAANWAEWCNAKGRTASAIRYWKLMKSIENIMWSYPSTNEMRG